MSSFDASAALRVPGMVNVVEVDGAVAAVAQGVAAALAGRDALKINWDLGGACRLDSAAIRERLVAALQRRGARAGERGDVERALRRAKRVLEAQYETPYLAHATMEPMNCVAAMGKSSHEDVCDRFLSSGHVHKLALLGVSGASSIL